MNSTVSQLSDEMLARFFFRRLWQAYGAGGVNAGRSLKSDLVEVYMSLHDYDDIPDIPVGLRECAEEADKRVCFSRYQQRFFGDINSLELIPSQDIGLLCIDGLHKWYENHQGEMERDGYVANLFECRFISKICKIIPIPFLPNIDSDSDIIRLVREGRERVRIKLQEEDLL